MNARRIACGVAIGVCHSAALAQSLPDDPGTRDFAVCRLEFESDRYEAAGSGWKTDYPLADINLMTRLGEITSIRTSENNNGDPAHRLVKTTDRDMYSCPILLASDAGTMNLSSIEARHLRHYLLKGGSLWSDDTWGNSAWDQLQREIGKVFPEGWGRTLAVPLTHHIFHTHFVVGELPQISNIGYWHSHGHDTSERGSESAIPTMSSVSAPDGRIMIILTHNTDIADAWEQEADAAFFEAFAAPGYALGVNIVLYLLTH